MNKGDEVIILDSVREYKYVVPELIKAIGTKARIIQFDIQDDALILYKGEFGIEYMHYVRKTDLAPINRDIKVPCLVCNEWLDSNARATHKCG